MAVKKRNLRNLLKSKLVGFPSLIQPLIFVLFIALFSRVENTIAYSKDNSDKSYTEAVQKAQEQNISDEMLFEQVGSSSWYNNKFHKRKTSNGERYDKNKLTAAHKQLPFGSIVKVTNLSTGNATFVRINDRGPFLRKRIIDLSRFAASSLGALGNPKVKIETLLPNNSFANEEEAAKYLLAFSYDQKPSCILAENFNIVKEYDNFDSAAEELEKIHHYNKSSKVYLLTNPNLNSDFHLDEKNTGKYYIGFSKLDFELSFLQIL